MPTPDVPTSFSSAAPRWGFWKWAGCVAVLGCLMHCGAVAWMTQFRPDPTEILVLVPERALPGESIRLHILVRDGRASDVVIPGAEVTARWKCGGRAESRGRTEADGVAEIMIRVPESGKEDTVTCRISARAPTGQNRVDVPVRLDPGPGISGPAFSEPEEALDEGLQVDLVPESGELVRNVENVVWVRTTKPDGHPVRAVVITGGASRAETDGTGVGTFRITPQSAGSESGERLTVSARDTEGRELREERSLPVGARAAGLLVRPAQIEIRAGEPVAAEVFTASRASRAVVNWVQDGRVVGTSTVPLADRKGRAETMLTAGTQGWVRVEARAFPGTGEVVSDVRWIRVVPSEGDEVISAEPGVLGVRLAEAAAREKVGEPWRGGTYRERWDQWAARLGAARRSRLGWLGWFPFGVTVAAGIGILLCAWSRIESARVPGARSAAARLGGGLAAGAGALAGIATFIPSGVEQVVAMVVITAVGTVGLAVGGRDLRDLPGAVALLPGVRRAARLVPVMFGGSGLAWLGTLLAERWGAEGAVAGPGGGVLGGLVAVALAWMVLWFRIKG